MARRFYVRVYIHLIWRTKHSRSLLSRPVEDHVHRCLREFGKEMGLRPLGVNSAWDHTHSLFGWNSTVALSTAVKRLKGRTSCEWNKKIDAGDIEGPRLEWQRGYGAVSIHRSDIKATLRYIDRQKRHHAQPTCDCLWREFEATKFDEHDDQSEQCAP